MATDNRVRISVMEEKPEEFAVRAAEKMPGEVVEPLYGKTAETSAFLYADGDDIVLSMHYDTEEAYLARAKHEIAGRVVTNIAVMRRSTMDRSVTDEELIANLIAVVEEKLHGEFPAAYFAQADAMERIALLGEEEIALLEQRAANISDAVMRTALTCGAVFTKPDGNTRIIENGCFSAFVDVCEREMLTGSRPRAVHFDELPRLNTPIAKIRENARETLEGIAQESPAVAPAPLPDFSDLDLPEPALKRLMAYAALA